MNLFSNLFGKPKMTEEDKTKRIRNTLALITDTINSQNKRRAHIEKMMESLLAEAKVFASSNKKESALMSLKKRKMYEKQVKIIDDSVFNLEIQKMNIENTQIHKSAYESLVQANLLLKDTNLTIEKVEDVMDELQDNIQQQEDVSEALSRPLLNIDVEDELKLLQLDEPIVIPNIPIQLPNVPKFPLVPKPIQIPKDEEEEEIALLKKELAL
jgi:charged multivesicular body protein 6